MSVRSRRSTPRRFLSATEGKGFQPYDLSGQQQRIQQLHQALNGMSEALSQIITRELRRMLNHDRLQASCGSWQFSAPDTVDFWLSAFCPGPTAETVMFGIDRASVFSLSELFFGSDPGKLPARQIETRVLADTERRLCNRLLDLVLTLVGGEFRLSRMDWQSRWLDDSQPLPDDLFWCPVTVSTDDWSLTFHIGWPVALSNRTAPDDMSQEDIRAGMAQGLRRVSARLKVEIGHVDTTLSALSELRVGDILPLDLGGEVSARAGGMPCIKGLVCESGDRLALRMTQVVGDE